MCVQTKGTGLAMAGGTVRASALRCPIGATYEGGDPALLERLLPFVDYIEVTPETIAEATGRGARLRPDILAELKDLARSTRIVAHGVSLSIGSHEGWSETYLRLLDELLERIDVAWHSEHLAYTKVDGQHLGIMLALPKTEQVLDMVCERVVALQRRYALPFLLENVVHVVPDYPGEYSDARFLNELAERTGCGLILDAYNLECDAHNHRFDIPAFLSELQMRHVREVHVACGVEHNGFLLDVHSRLTRPSTLGLAQRFVSEANGNAQAVVYEFMPEAIAGLGYEAIGGEMARLKRAFGN